MEVIAVLSVFAALFVLVLIATRDAINIFIDKGIRNPRSTYFERFSKTMTSYYTSRRGIMCFVSVMAGIVGLGVLLQALSP